MSAMFDNIIIALEAMRALGRYPQSEAVSAMSQVRNAQTLDVARAHFYTDDISRQVFDWCCQNRIVEASYGSETGAKLPFPPFTREKWEVLEKRAESMLPGKYAEGDYLLDRIDTWLLESYTLRGQCEVRPGDVVLDCGSHSGNTCMYFSRKAGPQGMVHGFEPTPDTFACLQKNLAAYGNVRVHQCAVSDVSGTAGMFRGGKRDAGARLAPEGGLPVRTVTIDDFVREQGLARVDFIKMDIEGAEEAALRGAKGVITAYRPRLALSAYHRELDIVILPSLLLSFDPTYNFALRHFSLNSCETVLYCF